MPIAGLAPYIPDGPAGNLVSNVRWGIFFNAGQVCSAMARLIVHDDIYDDVLDAVVAMARDLSVGPGIEQVKFGNTMGAMISLRQRDRVAGICTQSSREGAKAVTGGRPLNRPGCFFEPTVFSGVMPDMSIARDEVFGPVLSVMRFSSDAQALDIANGTEYGLVGGVFTSNLDRAMQVARLMRAGQVFVNEWYAGGVETPFGGYGKSGYGREKGREALWNYVQTKNIAIKTGA